MANVLFFIQKILLTYITFQSTWQRIKGVDTENNLVSNCLVTDWSTQRKSNILNFVVDFFLCTHIAISLVEYSRTQSCWVQQDLWIGRSKTILCQTLHNLRLRDSPCSKRFHSKSGFVGSFSWSTVSTVWGHKHIVACYHGWFYDTHKCTRHCFTPQKAHRILPRSCVVLVSD